MMQKDGDVLIFTMLPVDTEHFSRMFQSIWMLERVVFSAYDVWNNSISGEGSLSKNGSGTLVLAENNSYTGGVHVNEGLLVTASSGGFGYSSVNNKAAVEETVSGAVQIHGDYHQTERSTLKLTITGAEDTLKIGGAAQFVDIQITGLSAEKQVICSSDGIVVANR